jgi:hypothetical protein
MIPPLVYEYQSDWRQATAHFRAGDGLKLVRRRLSGQLAQHVAIALLLIAACIVLLFTKAWFVAVGLAVPCYLKSRFALRLALATRASKFGLRRTFRETPTRNVKLIVDENGLQEQDGDIESICPWSSVTFFTYAKGIFSLHLSNGLRALVPEASLIPGSSSIAELVERCNEKNIPFREVEGATAA